MLRVAIPPEFQAPRAWMRQERFSVQQSHQLFLLCTMQFTRSHCSLESANTCAYALRHGTLMSLGDGLRFLRPRSPRSEQSAQQKRGTRAKPPTSWSRNTLCRSAELRRTRRPRREPMLLRICFQHSGSQHGAVQTRAGIPWPEHCKPGSKCPAALTLQAR